jgi:FixJ family two-component response regulator
VKASAGRVARGFRFGFVPAEGAAFVDNDALKSQSLSRADLEYASADEFLRCGDLNRVSGLIFDHHMAHITGSELAARLRAGGGSHPVPLITGAPSPAIAARPAKLGITKLLERPSGAPDVMEFFDGLGG